MGSTIPATVRRAVARRLDPWAVRRAETLLRRAASQVGESAAADSSAELDQLQRRSLQVLAAQADRGELAADTRLLSRIAAGYLSSLEPDQVPGVLEKPIARAFTALWNPDAEPVPPPSPAVERAISDQFHRLYYHVSSRTWKNTTYCGVRTYKCPTDMWIYTELIDRLRPQLIIETGTFLGGSALYLAHLLDRIGHGEVVTVDIEESLARPEHPRITYLGGSSTAPEIVEKVRGRLPAAGHVLVILDSNHERDHVAAELAAYAPMVTLDSYLIVEDTNVNGHPAWPSWGPGPFEAAHDFLADRDDFVIDRDCERYYLTQNPDGFLRRVR